MDALKIIRDVRNLLAASPASASEVLRAVADGLADYEAAQALLRDAKSDRAILTLITLVQQYPRAKALGLPFWIDVVWHHFPKGPVAHSRVECAFWEDFIKIAGKEPLDRKWVRDTRGEACLTWWDSVVVPAMEKSPC